MYSDHSPVFLERQAIRLCQESIVNRFFGKFRYKGKCLFPDDRVKALNGRPLGMFFYNLRFIFLACSLVFSVTLWLWSWFPSSTEEMRRTGMVLTLGWLIDAVITGLFHKSFIKDLDEWAQQRNPREFPPLFNRYFALDTLIVLLLFVVGQVWHLKHDALAFLIFANLVVYSAYFPTTRRINRFTTVIFFLIVLSSLILFAVDIQSGERQLFYALLYVGPILGMSLGTVLAVLVISGLRATEQEITIRCLKLLGEYEDKLSPPEPQIPLSDTLSGSELSAKQFRNQVSEVLEGLCTLCAPFWYRSACLWFLEKHQDRGELLLPAAWFNFAEVDQYKRGISAKSGLLNSETLVMVHSLRHQRSESNTTPEDIRSELEAPAAFIPLKQSRGRVGVLALYGAQNGPPLQRQDEEFLKSLGSIMSNTLGQWEGLYKTQPQGEMDELLRCDKLVEVFEKTAVIMQKYLGAGGCMVVFRPNPTAKEMFIKAKIGFSDAILESNQYEVGKGLTGECAETGKPIRIDDVPRHRHKFDNDMLGGLEKAHKEAKGGEIVSWMAIPIGTSKNYGVIKVVNRTFRSAWFSDEDEQLGLSLALRLKVVIEKFLFIEQMERAVEDAKSKSAEARHLLDQRQEDLMVTMHQLQGPLASMLGSISYLRTKLLPHEVLKLLPWSLQKDAQEELSNLEDFVRDSIALSYGTFTTFALEAGRQASFGIHKIDAPEELKRLARRLQKTNARPDLSFSFYAERDFPLLQMDKKVFTSVLYSLIHNAMKYADTHSQVSLVCATERGTREAVLKVKSVGEPIHISERDTIFEKFGRGRVVTSTGRYHSGVGLGLWVAKKLMRTIGGDLTVELPLGNPRLSVFVVHIPKSPKVSKGPAPVPDTIKGATVSE